MKMVQVGLGGFGRRWMDIVLKDSKWEYSAIATRNETVRSECGELCHLPPAALKTTLEEALEYSDDADAVLITTPYFKHTDQILLALSKGKHVLVEKPLCETLAEAIKIRDAVDKSGKTLMVGENYRFGVGAVKMQELMSAGVIGKPELLFLQYFVHHRFPETDWRNEYRYPVLIENATHQFDLIRFITGKEPKTVQASAFGSDLTPHWEFPSMSVQFEMTDGFSAHYAASWAYDGFRTPWEGYWRLYGTEGAIEWNRDVITVFKEGNEKTYAVGSRASSHTLEMVWQEFTTAMAEGRRPSVDIHDNLQTVRMVFNAIDAAESGRRTAIDDQ